MSKYSIEVELPLLFELGIVVKRMLLVMAKDLEDDRLRFQILQEGLCDCYSYLGKKQLQTRH